MGGVMSAMNVGMFDGLVPFLKKQKSPVQIVDRDVPIDGRRKVRIEIVMVDEVTGLVLRRRSVMGPMIVRPKGEVEVKYTMEFARADR
jgi:hypothetical protein